MLGATLKTSTLLFLITAITTMMRPVCWAQQDFNIEVEAPSVLSYNSPLRSPDSLKSRPYFDFLSMLYRHDVTKSDLFRPYKRAQRSLKQHNSKQLETMTPMRQRRAIVFRPLFVYRQQQIKRQSIRGQPQKQYGG